MFTHIRPFWAPTTLTKAEEIELKAIKKVYLDCRLNDTIGDLEGSVLEQFALMNPRIERGKNVLFPQAQAIALQLKQYEMYRRERIFRKGYENDPINRVRILMLQEAAWLAKTSVDDESIQRIRQCRTFLFQLCKDQVFLYDDGIFGEDQDSFHRTLEAMGNILDQAEKRLLAERERQSCRDDFEEARGCTADIRVAMERISYHLFSEHKHYKIPLTEALSQAQSNERFKEALDNRKGVMLRRVILRREALENSQIGKVISLWDKDVDLLLPNGDVNPRWVRALRGEQHELTLEAQNLPLGLPQACLGDKDSIEPLVTDLIRLHALILCFDTLSQKMTDFWALSGWYGDCMVLCGMPKLVTQILQDTINFIDRYLKEADSLIHRMKGYKKAGLDSAKSPFKQHLFAVRIEYDKLQTASEKFSEKLNEVINKIKDVKGLEFLNQASKKRLLKAYEDNYFEMSQIRQAIGLTAPSEDILDDIAPCLFAKTMPAMSTALVSDEAHQKLDTQEGVTLKGGKMEEKMLNLPASETDEGIVHHIEARSLDEKGFYEEIITCKASEEGLTLSLCETNSIFVEQNIRLATQLDQHGIDVGDQQWLRASHPQKRSWGIFVEWNLRFELWSWSCDLQDTLDPLFESLSDLSYLLKRPRSIPFKSLEKLRAFMFKLETFQSRLNTWKESLWFWCRRAKREVRSWEYCLSQIQERVREIEVKAKKRCCEIWFHQAEERFWQSDGAGLRQALKVAADLKSQEAKILLMACYKSGFGGQRDLNQAQYYQKALAPSSQDTKEWLWQDFKTWLDEEQPEGLSFLASLAFYEEGSKDANLKDSIWCAQGSLGKKFSLRIVDVLNTYIEQRHPGPLCAMVLAQAHGAILLDIERFSELVLSLVPDRLDVVSEVIEIFSKEELPYCKNEALLEALWSPLWTTLELSLDPEQQAYAECLLNHLKAQFESLRIQKALDQERGKLIYLERHVVYCKQQEKKAQEEKNRLFLEELEEMRSDLSKEAKRIRTQFQDSILFEQDWDKENIGYSKKAKKIQHKLHNMLFSQPQDSILFEQDWVYENIRAFNQCNLQELKKSSFRKARWIREGQWEDLKNHEKTVWDAIDFFKHNHTKHGIQRSLMYLQFVWHQGSLNSKKWAWNILYDECLKASEDSYLFQTEWVFEALKDSWKQGFQTWNLNQNLKTLSFHSWDRKTYNNIQTKFEQARNKGLEPCVKPVASEALKVSVTPVVIVPDTQHSNLQTALHEATALKGLGGQHS